MNNEHKKLRIAVVGIGGRGVWAAGELARHPGYELAALCDLNKGKLEHARKSLGLEQTPVFQSFEKCLAEMEFDAVAVTTHDGAHAEIAVPAIEAGKHVFLEKPLDITEENCRAIVEADRKAGGRTFVGHNLRFAPVYVKIREMLDQGVAGELLTMQSDEFYDGGRTYFRRWNRLRRFGGGLWITKSSHDFDILHWMAGRAPVSVYARSGLSVYKPRPDAPLYCGECEKDGSCPDGFGSIKKMRGITHKILPEIGAEHGEPRPDLCLYNSDKDTFDHGAALIEFDGRLLATHTCNVVTGFDNRRLRVSGTRATIDGDLAANSIVLRRRDPSGVEEIKPGAAEGGHGGADSFIFDSFLEFARGRCRAKVPPIEAMTAVLMGLAANRSEDEGRPVMMSEFSPS